MMRLRLLDRYVLRSWFTIFAVTAVGFPVVSVLINVVDFLERNLERGLTPKDIFISYAYALPQHMFQVMPAATLFATIFTIGALGRHSELTAAKASGQSFFRIVFPIFVAGTLAMALDIFVGELAPGANAKSLKIQRGKQAAPQSARYNFVYRADQGWVYTIKSLDVANRSLRETLLERQGTGPQYPGLAVVADSATYDDSLRTWRLWSGVSRRFAGGNDLADFAFRAMRLRVLKQSPADLLVEPKAPEEMRFAELGRYITAFRRSGNDASKLQVDRALKLALPATCLIVAIFGAPLAITTPRTGTAVGIALSLGTTVIFLSMIQLARAVGASGIMEPTLATWTPNLIALALGVGLMTQVKS